MATRPSDIHQTDRWGWRPDGSGGIEWWAEDTPGSGDWGQVAGGSGGVSSLDLSTAISDHAAAVDPHGDRSYADGLFAANDAMLFMGVINCVANPNFPAASVGNTYRVSVAGKVGGASGTNVEVGDLLICTTDTIAGTLADVGVNWTIGQTNADGMVIGPASATDSNVVLFDGTSGRLIKDGGALGTAAFAATGDFATAAEGTDGASAWASLGEDVDFAGSMVTALGLKVSLDSALVTKPVSIYVIPAATAVTTGDGKAYFAIPSTMNGMNLISCAVTVITTSSSGLPTVQIARGRQSAANSAHSFVDMLTTKASIDVGEYDSINGTTPVVVNTSNDDVATGDLIRVDVDIAGTGTQGLIVTLVFQLP